MRLHQLLFWLYILAAVSRIAEIPLFSPKLLVPPGIKMGAFFLYRFQIMEEWTKAMTRDSSSQGGE